MRRGAAGLLVAVAVTACGAGPEPRPAGGPSTVELRPVRETGARGEVRLEGSARELRVTVRLSGLRPRWSYTLFVAERGDCGGTEAGGGRTIPLAGALRTAAGELPPLVSDEAGNAELVVRVAATMRDLAGRAIVLQPDGYGRAACGGVPPG